MNLEFQSLIPAGFHPSSRVWIYQSNRALSPGESLELKPMLSSFVENWKSHGAPVKGFALQLFDRFILLMADETAAEVSGCSTDSSVKLIRDIEQKFGVQLLDRQNLAFVLNDTIETIPMSDIENALQDEIINPGTFYFNNTVLTKKELIENWIIKLENSWLNRFITNKV